LYTQSPLQAHCSGLTFADAPCPQQHARHVYI